MIVRDLLHTRYKGEAEGGGHGIANGSFARANYD